MLKISLHGITIEDQELESCGARTRGGASCRSLPVHGQKRCRMHGGKSLDGWRHPNYKHGQFTKRAITARKAEAEARRQSRQKRKEFFDALEAGDVDAIRQTSPGSILTRSQIRQLLEPEE